MRKAPTPHLSASRPVAGGSDPQLTGEAGLIAPSRADTILSHLQGVDPRKISQVFDLLSRLKNDSNQVRDIVPMKDWVMDPYYLGPEAQCLYPFWRDVLVEFEEGGHRELILSGSIRSGKSYTAEILAIRKWYELSCHRVIPEIFRLSVSSQLVFIYLATSVRQAFLQGLGRIRRMYDHIPYFQEHFPRDLSIESMLIPRETEQVIFLGGSEIGHFIGSDLFLIILDEANFVKGSAAGKYERAVDIYRESKTRRQATFMVEGVEHGCGIVISSADTQSSFVESRKEASRSDPEIMVVDAVAYKVQPWKYKGVARFWVFEGDDYIDPFMMEDVDALTNYIKHYSSPQDPSTFNPHRLLPEDYVKWHSVPRTFLEVFRLDIFGALKEVCGVAVGVKGRFFTNRVKYNSCFSLLSKDRHPFIKSELTCSYLDDEQIFNYFKPDQPVFDSRKEYFGHIDQSLVTDSTGAALVHFDPEEDNPIIYVDFMLRINPPPKPGKISPEKVAKLFIYCRSLGASTIRVTSDFRASEQSQQTLALAGAEGEHLSVDKDWTPYKTVSGLVLTERIRGYHYPPFRKELFALIQDNDRNKVDHPPDGSKDVADALVGAVYGAYQEILKIKSGLRYWPEFSHLNLVEGVGAEERNTVVVGIYQKSNLIYHLTISRRGYGDGKRTYTDRIVCHSEEVRYTVDIDQLATALKAHKKQHKGIFIVAANSYAKPTGDITASSLVKQLRHRDVSVRCRKRLNYKNFESIRDLMRDTHNPELLIEEKKCPQLVRAFRKAEYRDVHGVKTNEMRESNDTFPLYALRVAIAEVMINSVAQGY